MVKQERVDQQPDNDHGKTRNRPQNRRARLKAWIRVRWRWMRIRRWQIARWTAVILAVVTGLVFASRYVSGDTDPIQFVTGNLLNVLIFAAIVAQVLIYRKQRDIMRHQWKSMQGQLDAIEKQSGFIETQSQTAIDALTETRKMVDQNERAVKAAEDNAKTAREAFYVGQAPYFGISRMVWLDFDVGYSPQLVMEFVNGGKTPAWLFYALPTVVFGDSPEEGEHWNLMPARDDIVNSFIPSDKSAEIKFINHLFRYTKEMRDQVEAESAYLFVVVTLTYRDFRKRDHKRVLKYVWNRRTWVFSDYETTNTAPHEAEHDNN